MGIAHVYGWSGEEIAEESKNGQMGPRKARMLYHHGIRAQIPQSGIHES